MRPDGGGRQGKRPRARELPVQVRPAGAVTSGGKSGRGYSASLRRGRSARDKSPRHQQNGSGDDRRQVRPAGAAYVPAEVTTPAKTGRAPVSSPRHQHDAPDDRALQGLPVRRNGGEGQGGDRCHGAVHARAFSGIVPTRESAVTVSKPKTERVHVAKTRKCLNCDTPSRSPRPAKPPTAIPARRQTFRRRSRSSPCRPNHLIWTPKPP